MGVFDFFKSKQDDLNWEEIRKTAKAYPVNSISIFSTESESGKPATGWVDKGYVDYPYKKYCRFNLQFNIWLNDSDDPALDMGTVEDFFVDKLKRSCVVHRVSRVATDFGMIMDLYVDRPQEAQEILGELLEDENTIVEFGCGFNDDPEWKEYERILGVL